STSARNELLALPGVLQVEPELGIPVKLRANQHVRDVVLEGRRPEATLQRIVAFPLKIVPVPERGAVISEELARVLEVKPGQTLRIEPYAGDRRARELLVAGSVADTFGLRVHMSLESLWRTFDEWGVMSSALLRVDGRRETELLSRLSDTPMVLSVTRRQAIIDRFRQQTADNMYAVTFVLTAFAATIAVGVVYNNARIALALRARDLSSLRVLGFTRAEISRVLLGELFVQVFVALPLGLGIGVRLSHLLFSSMDRELYRFPVVISGRTYAFACLVTLLAAALSALLVRRRLDRLDLVAVLKTRE
ncbi:MAG TPA: ABC transporter permease, partial [Polyangiaceae bacterium]|nr:ABC transporter permease [Polyangiaceae bacterium]